MAIAGELMMLLGFKIEGQDKLRQFNEQINQTENSAEKSASRLRSFASAAKVVGGAVAAAGVTFGVAATRQFAGLEREMNRIGITAGATVEQTSKATQSVQKMAQDLALPIDQAVAGLDTLTASGMDLDEAMAFLPSVLTTAQAAGASTVDIANTAQKAASALGLQSDQLQRAFDIMVTGGKAGQFELKDMASFIPGLANSFASLGYKGEDGLKRLIAVLQTVRADTGDAGTAATQVGEILGKIYSGQNIKAFKEFGINLPKELDRAKKSGEDLLEAFIRLSKQAIKGDLSKLPQLFTDKEFRLGMQSLITSTKDYERFLAAVNSGEVDGATLRDLQRILGDTQSSIDRATTSWNRFVNAVGEELAPGAATILDAATNKIEFERARDTALEGMGYNWLQRRGYVATHSVYEQDAIARSRGGYSGPRLAGTSQRDAERSSMDKYASEMENDAYVRDTLKKFHSGLPSPVQPIDQSDRSVQITVGPTTVQVAQPTSAPGAVGAAVGAAIGQAAAGQASRIEQGPTF